MEEIKPDVAVAIEAKPEGNGIAVPEGLDVSDGETLDLTTTYNVTDGMLYPTAVNGIEISADKPKSLEDKRSMYQKQAEEADEQVGYN